MYENNFNVESNCTDGDGKMGKVYENVKNTTGMTIDPKGDYGHYQNNLDKKILAKASLLVERGVYPNLDISKKFCKCLFDHVKKYAIYPSKGNYDKFVELVQPSLHHYLSLSMLK